MTPNDAKREPDAPTGTRRARRRGWLRLVVLVGFAAILALVASFFSFANRLPRAEAPPPRAADGIVVLTGGASRIVDAVELLAANHGKRLLISGVNPSTTRNELIRMNPDVERLLMGRIDLGREATNTIGNAVETGQWARAQGFRSLIVVTSGWHMPRALVEIAHELPGATLIPHSVVSERMRDEPWWSDAQIVRLLAVEYVKYLAAYARINLSPARLAGGNRPRQS